ncbi:hypothetical protein WN51_01947 [Melipona quadrifasciata]|uniref:Uncharacterized protein n=1 Tax=Melipona quadrifasciata TaxID=166423 RepID=A0A0M9AD22_9HYME|nr:hypothetical protein WN51_01947 [Melipona quadrifasciata]
MNPKNVVQSNSALAGKRERAKGTLTLSSSDKGPILGPHGVLARQWEQTLDEKYSGLKEREFPVKEWREEVNAFHMFRDYAGPRVPLYTPGSVGGTTIAKANNAAEPPSKTERVLDYSHPVVFHLRKFERVQNLKLLNTCTEYHNAMYIFLDEREKCNMYCKTYYTLSSNVRNSRNCFHPLRESFVSGFDTAVLYVLCKTDRCTNYECSRSTCTGFSSFINEIDSFGPRFPVSAHKLHVMPATRTVDMKII